MYPFVEAYAKMLQKNGLKGVFINGSSGEGYMLSTEERMQGSETLKQIRQIPGVKNVITTLFGKQAGELWLPEEIAELKKVVCDAGLDPFGSFLDGLVDSRNVAVRGVVSLSSESKLEPKRKITSLRKKYSTILDCA